MSITSKVRQSVILAADGQVQSLVGGVATNITKANIMIVYGQASAADADTAVSKSEILSDVIEPLSTCSTFSLFLTFVSV